MTHPHLDLIPEDRVAPEIVRALMRRLAAAEAVCDEVERYLPIHSPHQFGDTRPLHDAWLDWRAGRAEHMAREYLIKLPDEGRPLVVQEIRAGDVVPVYQATPDAFYRFPPGPHLWQVCMTCNTDRHECLGCGASLRHDNIYESATGKRHFCPTLDDSDSCPSCGAQGTWIGPPDSPFCEDNWHNGV
jgi:hypothetical protein